MSSRLEEEALKRRERLKQLKRKAEGGESDGLARPVFRSYNPQSEVLADDNAEPDGEGKMLPSEEMAEKIVDQIHATKDETVVDEVDLVTLAPRKIDWDLKRDIQKKLDKLERKTQKCIAELIRERLSSGKEDLLSSAVNSSATAAETGHASDEDD